PAAKVPQLLLGRLDAKREYPRLLQSGRQRRALLVQTISLNQRPKLAAECPQQAQGILTLIEKTAEDRQCITHAAGADGVKDDPHLLRPALSHQLVHVAGIDPFRVA